jgi:transposase
MFQDEAIFGRIGKMHKCWIWDNGNRPIIKSQKIREYRYLYGATDPLTGESCFRIISHVDTVCMNAYLKELSEQFSETYVLLVCDNAGWHKSHGLIIPNNIELIFIPPYTPEMNPQEQVWDEIREKYFANRFFASLEDAVQMLCEAVQGLKTSTLSSLTCRHWICEQFI